MSRFRSTAQARALLSALAVSEASGLCSAETDLTDSFALFGFFFFSILFFFFVSGRGTLSRWQSIKNNKTPNPAAVIHPSPFTEPHQLPLNAEVMLAMLTTSLSQDRSLRQAGLSPRLSNFLLSREVKVNCRQPASTACPWGSLSLADKQGICSFLRSPAFLSTLIVQLSPLCAALGHDGMYWERARGAEASLVHPTASLRDIPQHTGTSRLHGSIQTPGDPLTQEL